MLIPSIFIEDSTLGLCWIGYNLKRALIKLLFPAPVLPTTPTFCPVGILKESFLRVSLISFGYLRLILLNVIYPVFGKWDKMVLSRGGLSCRF